MCKVVNIRYSNCTVYCGRPGKGITDAPFGNPFTVQEYGKGVALAKFSRWFKSDEPAAIAMRETIKNRIIKDDVLGCFCKDQSGSGTCHADIIAKFVENDYDISKI